MGWFENDIWSYYPIRILQDDLGRMWWDMFNYLHISFVDFKDNEGTDHKLAVSSTFRQYFITFSRLSISPAYS